MRSRNLIFIVGLVVLSAFLLMVVGCSDDDSAPTQVFDDGDTDSIAHPQFSAVKDQVEGFVDDTRGFVNDGLSMTVASAQELDDLVFGPVPPDSSQTSDYWLIYFLWQSSLRIWALDSIRFLDDGVPQETALGADQILFRHYWRKSVDDTTVSYTIFDIHSDLDITGVDGTTATANGTHDLAVESKYVSDDSTVWWTFDVQATITDYTVNKADTYWNYGCPVSGSMTVTVDASYQKDSGEAVNTSWRFDLTLTDGLMDADVTLGSQTCSYSTQVCTPE